MEGEESAVEVLAEDEFSKAFDSFTAGLGESPKEEPEKAVETPVEPAQPAAEVAEPAKETPAAVVETPVEKPAPAPATTEDVTRIVTEALKKPEPEKPAVPETPAEEAESPEALKALAELEKDWSDHKVAVELLLKRQEKQLTDKFEKILEPLKAQIAPVVAQAAVESEEKFKAALVSAHADAYEIVPALEKWISEQPAFLQPAYNQTIDHGSAAQVIEVFNLYKASLPKPAATDPAKEAAEAQRQDKLERMRAPATARTSVTAETDPQDYDSAWETAAKKAQFN